MVGSIFTYYLTGWPRRCAPRHDDNLKIRKNSNMDSHGHQNEIMSRRALIFYLLKDNSEPSRYGFASFPFGLYDFAHSVAAIVCSKSYRERLSQEYSYKFQNYWLPTFVFGRSYLDSTRPKTPVDAHRLAQQITQPDTTDYDIDPSTSYVKVSPSDELASDGPRGPKR